MLEINKVHNIDCIEGLKQISNNSIDLIVIDPPYFLPATHYHTRKEFRRNLSDLGVLEHFFRNVFNEFTGFI